MEDSAFHRLSPRHRDCLRLTYAHLTTKEIARELGIGAGTVNGYLAEARAILGARNRREAAVTFHAFEAAADPAPFDLQGHSDGVAQPPAPPSPPPSVERSASVWGPLDPGNKRADNELGIGARIGWIIGLAFILASGFAAFAGGARTLSELFLTIGRTLPG